MKTLSIDIETFSSCSLQKSGVYRYVEAPDFEILLFGYSVDAGPVKVIDLACGEKIPDDILDALTDETVIKSAFNAAFERVCLSEYLKRMGRSLDPFHDNHPLSTELAPYLNSESWRCSMIWAATMGLPLSLEGVGAVLGLEKQKLTEGKELIKLFCQPCVPTKANNGRTRNRPEDEPVKWAAFKRYNVRDVETEMSIQERLQKFPVPDFIWDEYHIDQEINDRGVMIDLPLVWQAIDMDTRSRTELTKAMKHLTELDNPNSVQQMKQWLSDNGMETDSLGKKVVAELIKGAPPELQRVLILRQQLAKSSVKKYQSMVNAVCEDGRARGMFQFYGSRTGRWAGRLIQMQNLPQNHLPDLAEARALVRAGDYDSVEMLYEDVPDTLSQLIRTAFIPKDGNKFIVSDFSAIEARVIAWLAGEAWRQEVFAKGGDIYCASASQMFKVPVEKHGINGHLRQKGKIAELALGYGGSVGALKAMGAIEMGLTEDELPPLVEAWRQSNPHIVMLWWDVDHAAMEAVKYHSTVKTHGILFSYRSGMLFITLPSGRSLAYVKPKIGTNKFGGECITFEGTGGTKKWERLDTYGPKLVENIVQATSRDILCYAMKTLRCCSIVILKPNGYRQFNTAYVEIPKKNGKSELAAAIALLLCCGDGEERAEVYGCAADRQQASIVFEVAADMVRMCPALSKRVKILASQKRIIYNPTNSFYQVLSAEAYSKHGFNIHGVVFDELHTQPNRKLFDVMTKGSGDARMQPLYFLITTAGTDTHSICYETHQKAMDILEGRKIDPTFYPVIYGAADNEDWTDPKVWKKANPSLGETIGMDKVVAACESARQNPGEENAFRQLRLNQWVKQAIRWMPMEKWDACASLVNEDDLEGRVCYGGLDLSSTTDITAFVLVFPPTNEDDRYILLPYFWVPEDTIDLRVRRDHVPYDVWERQGFLMTTEGNVVHYGFIEKYIERLGEKFNIREIAFDRWGAIQMVQNLEGMGFTVVPFGQGFKDMSPPTKELMKLVLEKKVTHGGHPVLRWMMDNIYIRTDPAGNIKADKEKSTEKIDGAIAAIMGLDRAIRCGNVSTASVYDDRGILFI